MSIHRTPTGSWKVMWRQGSRQRSKTFDRKADATRFATDLARRRNSVLVCRASWTARR